MSRTSAILGFVLAGFALTETASACSCAVLPPPLEALEAADLVFSGLAFEVVDPDSNVFARTVRFVARRSWKGPVADTMHVETARSTASCGYPFEVGETYLVYAYRGNIFANPYSTNLCTRTKPLADAVDDLAALGAGSPVPVDDQSLMELRLHVFPNPATEEVVVRYPSLAFETISIEVYDILGRRLISRSASGADDADVTSLDVRHLTAGLYIVSARSGQRILGQRPLVIR